MNTTTPLSGTAPSETKASPTSTIQVPVATAKPVASGKIDPKTLVVPGAAKGGEGGTAEREAETAPDAGKEGEGGDTASFTPIPLTNAEFLAAIFDNLPENARPIVTAKPGDPQMGGWIPHDAGTAEVICRSNLNTYFNCASVRPGADGNLAAQKDLAAAYHVLVLDDVGTKVKQALPDDIQPTWILETSPGNFQIGFKISPPMQDAGQVDALQQKIAAAGLTDKGALGMVRWVRLPKGINGKPKYQQGGKPFTCRLHAWNPDASYTSEVLASKLAPSAAIVPQARPMAKPQGRTSSLPLGNSVYSPRAAENPVLTALKERGLYKRELSPGKHDITCPWVKEHTDGLDDGAAYFEPNEKFDTGGFKCHHSHGSEYHIGEFLGFLEVDELAARHKPSIRLKHGAQHQINDACEDLLMRGGQFYQMGGILVSVRQDPLSGDVTVAPVTETELTLWMSKACNWLRHSKNEGWHIADVPEKQIRLMLKAATFGNVPRLTGLARQPYYRVDDGQLVTDSGYDPSSGRLAVFDPSSFPPVGKSRAEAEAALAKLRYLLREFQFESEVDEATALAAILTATIRPSIDLAPAFHVRAPASGSGKSYLCDVIGRFAGAGGASRMSYPKTSDEATKAILAALLGCPAVIEFDDMDTDWLAHGAINRALTATTITDRILGHSKTVTVSTNALFLGSGNNVGPVRDLSRRVATIRLNPRTATPGTTRYEGNPVASLVAERETFVSAVLTIIEAWRFAGSPKVATTPLASYGGAWSDYCRHPLVWLGLPDPATCLFEQMRNDPDAEQLQAVLEEWHLLYGDKPITLRRLLEDAVNTHLQDALMDLPVVERGSINKSKLGWYFKRNVNRIVGGCMLEKAESTERNAWRVVLAEPPVPPSPPSAPAGETPMQPRHNPEDAF